MKTVQFESEVGRDGVLSLRVPLGPVEPNTRVLVTIEPAPGGRDESERSHSDWHEFVERTYGCCANLGLEEPEDAEGN